MASLVSGHPQNCICLGCRVARKIRIGFLAAQNRRDLLGEMAFHAIYCSPCPDLVMRWTLAELDGPRMTRDWCAVGMPGLAMGYWLSRCERALAPLARRTVFSQESRLGSAMAASI